jgi:hypothetical protein
MRPDTEIRINPIKPLRLSARERLRQRGEEAQAKRDPDSYLRERGITVVAPTRTWVADARPLWRRLWDRLRGAYRYLADGESVGYVHVPDERR